LEELSFLFEVEEKFTGVLDKEREGLVFVKLVGLERLSPTVEDFKQDSF